MHKLQLGAAPAGILIAVAAVIAAIGGSTAAAAQPTPVTIHGSTTFAPGTHQGPVGTFTASGIGGCPSGTYSDQLVSFNPNGTRPVISETYVCADGDTLTARVAMHLAVVDAAGTQESDGTWRIVAATGGLVGLSGSGSVTGLNSGCSPVGTALAECTTGTGTVTAWVH